MTEILGDRQDVQDPTAMGEAVLQALRGAFYRSTEAERLYFSRLSRTYALLFALNTEPRLVEFFQEMTGEFHLFVGSDIIVRALSERYLAPEDQMMRNTLRMAREAGATLVLAEPVLDEVIAHLRSSDIEFQRHFVVPEAYLTATFAQHSDRILIRAYFYARGDDGLPSRPGSWRQFVEQFVDYGDLHRTSAKVALRRYLENQFGLAYDTTESLRSLIDSDELAELASLYKEVKALEVLAQNDALMTLAVYGRRKHEHELRGSSEFGYKTWWLTTESAIMKCAGRLITKHEGQRFVMRPDFLLQFISLAPTAADVRASYDKIFPSLLGIRLASRLEPKKFQTLMDDVGSAMELEDGRRQAAIAQLADRLKADFGRQTARLTSRARVVALPARGDTHQR